MPRWKRLACSIAVGLLALGLGLRIAEAATGGPTVEPTAAAERPGTAPTALAPDGSSAFVPGRPGRDPTIPGGRWPRGDAPTEPRDAPPASDATGDAWSLGFLKMGFSFFVGFSLGYALRKFLQLALVFSGVFFALMFALSYAGLLSVHWHVMDDLFQQLVGNLGEQLAGARSFVTGSLPSAGLAGLGLVAGYKRN